MSDDNISSGDIVFKSIYRSLRDALHPIGTVEYTELIENETVIKLYTRMHDKEEVWLINKSDIVTAKKSEKKSWFKSIFNLKQ